MKKIVVAAALVAASISPAWAAPIIGLYNTGVGAGGTKLAVGGQDSHYLVNGADSYVTNNALYYQSPNAGFVAGQPGGGGGSETYTLTFDVTGANLSTATLSGDVAYDNAVVVTLNGHVLYADLPPFQAGQSQYEAFNSLHGFSAPAADFISGANALSFSVIDYGAPTGLLVTNLAGSAAAVPEAATWAMMLVGFGMIGFGLRYRRKSTKVSFA